jgi:hypothetical protein
MRSPDDFDNLAKAFEGMAGALHAGHPIEWEDVRHACALAHTLWPVRAGGRDWVETQFEDGRHECLAMLPAAAEGDIRACMGLEKACHHIGMALHTKGRRLAHEGPRGGAAAAKPWEAAHDTRAAIRHLDQKYARWAMRPVPLAA